MPDPTLPPPEPLDAPARRRAGFRFDVLALAAFGFVFAAVKLNRTAAFDLAVTLRIQGRRSPRVARLMEAVSWPGFPPESRIIPPGIAAFLWLRRYRLEAMLQAAAWGTAVLSTVVKDVTRRQRPLPENVQVVVAKLGGSSFPSGHVLTYVGVYGFAAHLANSLIRPGWLRAIVVAPLVALVALVGPSRIYLGHHWPTDVIASYLLGIASLLGLMTLHDRLKRRATAR
jgi:membrane-associated phospholipid phosphatase